MKKSLFVAVVLTLTVITPGYAKEIGPVGRRIRAILAENQFSATVQYQREEHRFEEAMATKRNIAPMPELLMEDEAVAVYETGDEYYIAKKSNIQPDSKAEIREEPKVSVSPAVSDYVVTDKDAFIYNEASFNDFDYTPEQLEQIKAAREQAKINSQSIVSRVEDKPMVYTKVEYTPMRAEGFSSYRTRDALKIVREAEPELDAKAEFTSSTVQTAVATQQRAKKQREEYRPEKLDERHDGQAWEKIYNKEVSKDEFIPKTSSMSKSLRNAIDESQRLRAELKNILGDKDIDSAIAAAKMSEYKGENFTAKENRALDDMSKVNYPDNTLYLNYQENKIYKVKISANKETDIRLKEYEKVTDITVGNQDDLYINGYRGEKGIHPHITIKPYEDGVKTRMMVTTNYSRYQFDLESVPETDYHPYVLFNLSGNPSAPVNFGSGTVTGNATLKRTRRENKPIEVNDPDELNWNYFIKGKNYKPQYAWDDGRFTYILLPKKAYEHEIFILGMLDDKAKQIREFEIQDDFMKLYGTWSKIRLKIDKETVEIDNNGFIPE